MIEHELGEVDLEVGSLDAQVAKHGIRLPTAKELDGVRVHSSTEEGSGTTRVEGAGRQEGGVNARDVSEGVGSMAECIGDIGRFDGVPRAVVRMGAVVVVDGRVGRSVVQEEVSGNAAKSFGWAEEGVIVGAVAYLFAPDGILLVSECKGSIGDTLDGVLIMQRLGKL